MKILEDNEGSNRWWRTIRNGLCYRIAKKRPDIDVIIHEKSNRLGGVIATWQDGEWICDLAVNATVLIQRFGG